MRKRQRLVLAALCILSGTTPCFAQGGYGSTYQIDGAFPLGVFSNSFKTGYGGHVEFYMETENYLRFYVSVGFAHWNLDHDKVNERYMASGGKGTLQLDGRVNAFPLMLGVKLLTAQQQFRIYGLLEVGIVLDGAKVSGQKIENGSPTTNIDESSSESVAGLNFGGGILYALSDELSLDLGTRYHLVKTNTYYRTDFYGNQTEISSDKYLSVSLGLTYAFPSGK